MRRTLPTALVVALTLIGLVLTACNQTPLEPQEAAYAIDGPATSQISLTNVVQSVSGNAHVVDEARRLTVTFNIRKHADGSVDGWYNASVRGPGGADIKVRMDCLHVVGNQAWAGGTIMEAVNPDNIGRPVSMRFVDNGEGAKALPDEFGGIWEYYDCAAEPDLSTRQVIIGNLHVRS